MFRGRIEHKQPDGVVTPSLEIRVCEQTIELGCDGGIEIPPGTPPAITPVTARQSSNNFVCWGGSMATPEASPISRIFARMFCEGTPDQLAKPYAMWGICEPQIWYAVSQNDR